VSNVIKLPTENQGDDVMLVTLRVSELKALLRSELSATETRLGPDRLVDIDEAAKLLSVSEDYLYHNLKRLPFVRRLGPRLLRFSFNGIQKWIASKA
jgi:excisionase family DNA binding protein